MTSHNIRPEVNISSVFDHSIIILNVIDKLIYNVNEVFIFNRLHRILLLIVFFFYFVFDFLININGNIYNVSLYMLK